MAFASATKRLMAACKATREWNTPRFRRRLASLAKKPSTALVQAKPEVCAAKPEVCAAKPEVCAGRPEVCAGRPTWA